MSFAVRIPEVLPFLIGVLVLFGILAVGFHLIRRRRTAVVCCLLGLVGAGYMLYFFRDPPRHPPSDPNVVVAGADGVIMGIKEVQEPQFLSNRTVRISIFLSLFDVHVNRAPLAGRVTSLGYYPGRRFFTFQEKSSEENQHSAIVIEGSRTRCLVKQIVGPVARRVVYWLEPGQQLALGERIGMMKFGSRLDLYLPADDVDVSAKVGDRVRAGETVVATLRAPVSDVPAEGSVP